MPDGPSTIYYILVIMLIGLILRDANAIAFISQQISGIVIKSAMALEGRV